MSELECEGDYNIWRESHISFFKSIDKNFNCDMVVVFEIFELVKKL